MVNTQQMTLREGTQLAKAHCEAIGTDICDEKHYYTAICPILVCIPISALCSEVSCSTLQWQRSRMMDSPQCSKQWAWKALAEYFRRQT